MSVRDGRKRGRHIVIGTFGETKLCTFERSIVEKNIGGIHFLQKFIKKKTKHGNF